MQLEQIISQVRKFEKISYTEREEQFGHQLNKIEKAQRDKKKSKTELKMEQMKIL